MYARQVLTHHSFSSQTDTAVGIKQALDAVSCMDAAGNPDLNDAIQAASGPLNSLESAGEAVIAAQVRITLNDKSPRILTCGPLLGPFVR
jgi:hypothetical protein